MSNALQAMESLDRALFEHGKNQPGRANHLLGHVLRGLIIAGARFEEADFSAIEKCGVRSSNGTFSPLGESFYTLAVLWGNVTAAKSWEAAWGWEPWMWNGVATVPGVSTFESRHGYEPRKPPVTPRVCMLSVLVIAGKMWRVYDIDKDVLSLAHFPEDSGIEATYTRSGGGSLGRSGQSSERRSWPPGMRRASPRTPTPSICCPSGGTWTRRSPSTPTANTDVEPIPGCRPTGFIIMSSMPTSSMSACMRSATTGTTLQNTWPGSA